jgi:hypothetical protein
MVAPWRLQTPVVVACSHASCGVGRGFHGLIADQGEGVVLASEVSPAQSVGWLLENGTANWAIVYHASVPILIADNDRNYLDASAGASKLFGLSRDMIIGRKLDDFAARVSNRRSRSFGGAFWARASKRAHCAWPVRMEQCGTSSTRLKETCCPCATLWSCMTRRGPRKRPGDRLAA